MLVLCSVVALPIGTGSNKKRGAQDHPPERNHPLLPQEVREGGRRQRRIFCRQLGKYGLNIIIGYNSIKQHRIVLSLSFK